MLRQTLSTIPDLKDEDIDIVGASVGDFLITVTSSSVKLYVAVECAVVSTVCVEKSVDPALNLAISIFFGSELLSVKNNKPSIMLTPVIRLS